MPEPTLTFCVYPTGANEWRWHLMNSRQHIVALAAEHYRSEQECLNVVSHIKRCHQAPIEITSPSHPRRFG